MKTLEVVLLTKTARNRKILIFTMILTLIMRQNQPILSLLNALALRMIVMHKKCCAKLANSFKTIKMCLQNSNQSPPTSMVQELLHSCVTLITSGKGSAMWFKNVWNMYTKDSRQTMSVKLCWAKYLVCWSRSGPSYYAGSNVSLRGEWHRDVVRCQSTR